MQRNFFRGKIRAGGKAKIRQLGQGSKKISFSVPRGMKVNVKVKQG